MKKKIRVTMTCEYEPDPQDYGKGTTIEEMMAIDRISHKETFVFARNDFDVKFEIVSKN